MKQLFTQHIARIQQNVQLLLEQNDLAGIWLHAGQAKTLFLDDQTYPFKINPHFNYVFPYPKAQNSWLFLDGVNKPQIYFYSPQDYWHSVETPPQDHFFADSFDWTILTDEAAIKPFFGDLRHTVFLGEDEALARSLGFEQINPPKVLHFLHFERSIKSEFEIESIYQAQCSALAGHRAAKAAFFAGKSEFEINLAYLQATKQSDNNVPYGNIVAINQNAAVLHYTALSSTPPEKRLSFLLDAGTTANGYASDLTRTYAFDAQSEFAAMVAKLEQFKLDLIADLSVGINYLHYHTQMHQWISMMLHEFDLVRLPPEQIFDEGISRTFFPHGLGHLLGLQVHDVAGRQQNRRGTLKVPPEVYPSLRCTRELAEGMVLTVEPGFYFIDNLLKIAENSPPSRHFNWQKINALKPYGGIRTEDNVVMRATGAENLTAKAEQASAADEEAI